tara:strand:+ start:1091 stop:5671 length:4581 start_codon:yes stop_codon:yes gene_type:complete
LSDAATALNFDNSAAKQFYRRPLWPQTPAAGRAAEQLPLPPQPFRESRDLLPVGCDVVHSKRGAGTVIEELPDGRRVVKYEGVGHRKAEVHRYLPGSWNKLTTPQIEQLRSKCFEIDWLGLADLEASNSAPKQLSQMNGLSTKSLTAAWSHARNSARNSFKAPARSSWSSWRTSQPDSVDMRISAVVGQEHLQQGDVVRIDLDDAAALKKRERPVGLVVGTPHADKVSVRLDGKGRTLHFPPSQLVKYPTLSSKGVSLACLRSFRAAHKHLISGLSTDAVLQHLLVPIAERCQSSLAEAIQLSGALATDAERDDLVGEADVYVSFAGGTNFEALIDGLEEFEASRKADEERRTFYWFSPFSYDPACDRLETMPSLWIQNVLTRHIDAIGHTCLVVSAWKEPLALSRPWCFLEMVATAASGARLSVQMVPDDAPSFVHALQYQPDQVSQAIQRWCLDTKHAHFYSAAHRQAVAEAVNSLKRFAELDTIIAQQLREWAYREAEQAIHSVPAEQRASWQLLQQLAVLLMQQGVYSKAEPLLDESATHCHRQLGRHHDLTMRTDELRARLMRMQGKLAEAQSMLEDIVERRREVHGAESEATASVEEELGLVYQAQKKLAAAEPLFRSALEGRRKALGDLSDASSHEGAPVELKQHITTLNNLASLLRSQAGSKLEEAEPLLRECLKEKRTLLGDRHPETLIGVNQLGLLMQTMRRPDDAEVLFREALVGRREVLGRQHPQTLNAMGNLADLLRERGQLSSALHEIGDAVQVASSTLGPTHRVTLALQAKHDQIIAGLQRQALEGNHDSDAEDESRLKPEHSAELLSETSASSRLSPASYEALLGVLAHPREELLIVCSSADKDNSGTLDVAEFATVLSCLGVDSMHAIEQLLTVFGYNENRTQEIHTLLHIGRIERMRHKEAVERQRAETEQHAAKGLRRVVDNATLKLRRQVWNTLTLPHYDNRRERYVVQAAEVHSSSASESKHERMENLAFDPLTKRHHFDDVTLVSALGLQTVDEAVHEAGTAKRRRLERQKSNLNVVLHRRSATEGMPASSVELFLRAKQAWIRGRATARLVALEEDCTELRKLSRVYELVEAALPEQNRTHGEAEAMLQYHEMIMSVHDALRGASIRVRYFAQAQPGGNELPAWEQELPRLLIARRVRLGAQIGTVILATSVLVRIFKMMWLDRYTDPGTDLSTMEYRLECEAFWEVLGKTNATTAQALTGLSVSESGCNDVLMPYAILSLVPSINNVSLFVVTLLQLVFRENTNQTAIREVKTEAGVLLIVTQGFLRLCVVIMLLSDPVGEEMRKVSAGRMLLIAEVLDAFFLFVGQTLFICMDCCNQKAPKMRMALGLTLVISLIDGLWRRGRYTFPSEQGAMVEWSYFGDLGSSPKQQYISTFDFSVLSMLATGIITTVRWPHKLAFIRVRSDLYQVAAEKEGEHLAQRAKEQHRRVQRLASHRVRFPVEELNSRMRELSAGMPKGHDKQDPDHEDSDSADDFAEAATSKRVDHTSANPCYNAYISSKSV